RDGARDTPRAAGRERDPRRPRGRRAAAARVLPALEGAAGRQRVTVEGFLYHEAQLLDERRFEEWLELFTDDALYWVPEGEEEDPVRRVSIAYDDRRRLHERVLRLQSGFAYAQDPPSRTCHLVGNVRVQEADGELDVASSLIVAEV